MPVLPEVPATPTLLRREIEEQGPKYGTGLYKYLLMESEGKLAPFVKRLGITLRRRYGLAAIESVFHDGRLSSQGPYIDGAAKLTENCILLGYVRDSEMEEAMKAAAQGVADVQGEVSAVIARVLRRSPTPSASTAQSATNPLGPQNSGGTGKIFHPQPQGKKP